MTEPLVPDTANPSADDQAEVPKVKKPRAPRKTAKAKAEEVEAAPIDTDAASQPARAQDDEAASASTAPGGAVMEPVEVAECVMFMVTRNPKVTIRDIVVLPNTVDL